MPIVPTERISRFVLDDRHFGGGRVKFRAFDPPRTDVVISVGRSEGMTDAATWHWGEANVAMAGGRTVYARGDFRPEHLDECTANGSRLSIVEDEPPEHHANVIGYPPGDRKEVRKLLAQQLAARATLVVKPPAITSDSERQ